VDIFQVQSQFLLEYLVMIIGILILLVIPRYSQLFWNIDTKDTSIPPQKRLTSIDTLKGIAIISVIIIHACYLLGFEYNTLFDSILLSIVNNIFRFAIPVFLFTSGLLLKPFIWSGRGIIQFYGSKIIRIAIPYIIITTILWQIGYSGDITLPKLLISGEAAIPFYFIPVLFQLYLLYPLLDYIRKISPKYLLIGALSISLISFFIPDTWYLWDMPLCGQYLIFFVYGMVRKNIFIEAPSSIWQELIWIYFALQASIIVLLPYLNLNETIVKSLSFYNVQIFFGFAIIFIVWNYFQKSNPIATMIQNIVSPLGRISLWIFLFHFPIQQLIFVLYPFSDQLLIIQIILYTLIPIIITLPISFGSAYLYRNIELFILSLVKKNI
jgi:surface polysaccharide O-acyltransferase-like enzyme